MIHLRSLSFAVLVLLGWGGVATAQTGGAWTPDLVHSRAEFTVSHMVVSKVWGHIPIRSLVLETAPNSAVPTRIEALLDPAHLDTDNHERDADLRSPTYFDVTRYPVITFKSTAIKELSPVDYAVSGDLTIKNVTKSVTFPVHCEGHVPDSGGTRAGYTGTITIDRRAFGIDDARLTPAGVLLVGDSVTIGLTVEATTRFTLNR